MTEIIFFHVLKLFIKGFSIQFKTESEIGLRDTNLTVDEARGEVELGWADHPMWMARRPTLMPIRV
jgi:hypothetical protein